MRLHYAFQLGAGRHARDHDRHRSAVSADYVRTFRRRCEAGGLAIKCGYPARGIPKARVSRLAAFARPP